MNSIRFNLNFSRLVVLCLISLLFVAPIALQRDEPLTATSSGYGNSYLLSGDVIYREDFDTDVFAGSSWYRTDSSVAVDTEAGYLHFSSDGSYDDACRYETAISLPCTIEWRARLTSGGKDYTIPSLHINQDFDSGTLDLGIGANYKAWMFAKWGWTNFDLKVPTSEGVWRVMRASFTADGVFFWAKEDTDASFTYITALPAEFSTTDLMFGFSQPWDSLCDVDYIEIRDGVVESTLLKEDFSTDVFSSGDWTRTDDSIYVSSGNLHFSSDGSNNDQATFNTNLPTPFTVQWRGRLVSGGYDYVLPQMLSDASDESITIDLRCFDDHWKLYDQNFYTTPRPSAENIWFNVMLTVRADGADLWAKEDSESTTWADIGSATWDTQSADMVISFIQNWDAVLDVDFVNFWIGSELQETIDTSGPSIASISQSPTSPDDSDSVTVTAEITDPSGIAQAILSYSTDGGSSWINDTMTEVSGNYVCDIPAQSEGTSVHYRVYAEDSAGNWAISSIQSYEVSSATAGTQTAESTQPDGSDSQDLLEPLVQLLSQNGLFLIFLLVVLSVVYGGYRHKKSKTRESEFMQRQEKATLAKRIQALTKAYPRIGLAEMASQLGANQNDVRNTLLDLIADGQARGHIDRGTDEFVSATVVYGKGGPTDTVTVTSCPHCSAPMDRVVAKGESTKCPACGRLIVGN